MTDTVSHLNVKEHRFGLYNNSFIPKHYFIGSDMSSYGSITASLIGVMK